MVDLRLLVKETHEFVAFFGNSGASWRTVLTEMSQRLPFPVTPSSSCYLAFALKKSGYTFSKFAPKLQSVVTEQELGYLASEVALRLTDTSIAGIKINSKDPTNPNPVLCALAPPHISLQALGVSSINDIGGPDALACLRLIAIAGTRGILVAELHSDSSLKVRNNLVYTAVDRLVLCNLVLRRNITPLSASSSSSSSSGGGGEEAHRCLPKKKGVLLHLHRYSLAYDPTAKGERCRIEHSPNFYSSPIIPPVPSSTSSSSSTIT